MKLDFVLASDTHSLDLQTPAADYLLFAGDCTKTGSEPEFVAFNEWLSRQPQAKRFVTFGNSDKFAAHDCAAVRRILSNAVCLIDEEVTTPEGLRIYGSPWVVSDYDEVRARKDNWAFVLMNSSLAYPAKWQEIPENLDVLLTHGPPYGISDKQMPTKSLVGDGHLLNRLIQLASLNAAPKVHVFGHIHEGDRVTEKHGVKFLNASLLDCLSKPTKSPLVLTYENGAWSVTAS